MEAGLKQRVLVTAGASGIGLAIAVAFLGAGADVTVCDVDQNALASAKAAYPDLSGLVADVGVAEAVHALGAAMHGRLGGLDVLVNNAGIGGPRTPIDEVSDDDWDRVMKINVTGMFYMVREFAPAMKAQRSGCILNVSTTSTRTGLPDRAPYVVSKAAVEALTRNLARELGPFNIRANTLLPGSIENERGRALMRAKAEREGITYDAALQQRLAFISMRARIDPSEIGDAAVFLASNAARHITGQQLSVDGNVEWEG
jgi:NAD(P)-dependent dehydrogenase (short-subunit alcohol dehydrogenase family)